MKIVKKVRLFFLPAMLLPLILMVCSTIVISNYYANSHVERRVNGFFFVANPTKAIDHTMNDMLDELSQVAEHYPKQLLSKEYLKTVNQRIEHSFSYLVIRVDDTITYCGTKDTRKQINDKLPEYGSHYAKEHESLYMTDDKSEDFLVKQRDFEINGEKISIFIITCLEEIIPRFKKIVFQMFLAIFIILIIASAVVSTFIYRAFIRPIQALKAGTDRIKDGNWDEDVVISNQDELGELCTSFNDMRKTIKELMNERLAYEEDSRELISNISHDLKTPITAIKGYVEGIMDGVADSKEKMERYIRTIYNKANDMDSLINELALFSKIDSNVIPYHFKKIDIHDYFTDCIEELSMDMESKGFTLRYRNECSDGVMVVADVEKIKRTIHNLVTNAIKYNDKEKGHIYIRLYELSEFVQVEVEDNGEGISAYDLPHIFNRMYRVDNSRNSLKGGSGLGLAIAKKIIEEHGGKIWATSCPKVGTTIYFTLRKYQEDFINE